MSDNKKKVFTAFDTENNVYIARPANTLQTPKLPPAVYSVKRSASGQLYFEMIETRSDALMKLPTEEYSLIVNQIQTFLKPETKELFDHYGFLYKRSALLHGKPGTGKTCIVNKIADYVKEGGGIVLFNPSPEDLIEAINQINDIQPESTVMVIFEELDTILEDYESELLSILDGEVQKNNIIYMATTNYIEKIPARIRRPGRFASIIEVGFPTAAVRQFYLQAKLGADADIKEWAEVTRGFSIDELKETVLAVKCLGMPIQEIVERIRESKKDLTKDPEPEQMESDDDGAPLWPNRQSNYLRNKVLGKRR